MIARLLKWVLILVVFAGAAVASGYLVLRWVIRSENRVVVPEVTHRQVVYALEILSDLGLNTRVERTEFNDSVPIHYVISQDPAAGTEIKSGRDVRLVISKGPAVVRMPNLVGLRSAQAEVLIEEAGLCRGPTATTFHDRIGMDRIVAQHPAAGQRIDRTRCVQLLVCAGPMPTAVAMPLLEGRSMAEAVLLADAARLHVAPPDYRYDGHVPLNRVLSQQPPSGTRIAQGRQIELIVNSPLGRSPSDSQVNSAEPSLVRYRAPVGFLKQHVQARMIMDEIAVDLFDGFVAPNDELWFARPTLPGFHLEILADGRPASPEVLNGLPIDLTDPNPDSP